MVFGGNRRLRSKPASFGETTADEGSSAVCAPKASALNLLEKERDQR